MLWRFQFRPDARGYPAGESFVRASHGFGDMTVIVPRNLAIRVHASAGMGGCRFFGEDLAGRAVTVFSDTRLRECCEQADARRERWVRRKLKSFDHNEVNHGLRKHSGYNRGQYWPRSVESPQGAERTQQRVNDRAGRRDGGDGQGFRDSCIIIHGSGTRL